jgi:hypothetical protein
MLMTKEFSLINHYETKQNNFHLNQANNRQRFSPYQSIMILIDRY